MALDKIETEKTDKKLIHLLKDKIDILEKLILSQNRSISILNKRVELTEKTFIKMLDSKII